MFRIIKTRSSHWKKRGKSAVDRKTGNGRKSAQITVNIIGAVSPGHTGGSQFGRAEPLMLCGSITTSQSPGKCFCPTHKDWRGVLPRTFLRKLGGGVLHPDQGCPGIQATRSTQAGIGEGLESAGGRGTRPEPSC